MENSKGDLPAKEKLFDFNDLTPIEYLFVGSTAVVGGGRLTIDTLGSYLEKNKVNLWKELLTPVSIFRGKKTKEKVDSGRLEKKKLTGMIVVFDLAQLIELKTQGKKSYLELPALDGNGRTQPFFRVGLLVSDEKGEEKEIDASELRINPNFSRYVTLEKDSNGNNMVLRLVKI